MLSIGNCFLRLAPVTAETVNKSVDIPSVRRLAKRLYTLDGFQSTDVARHLCKRYGLIEILRRRCCCSSQMTCNILNRLMNFFSSLLLNC